MADKTFLSPEITTSAAARFWPKVDIAGRDDCWLWIGMRDRDGYGKFSFAGRAMGAHRMSFALRNGYIPPSAICICHRCDTPLCVNPEHLFEGSQADNVADMVAKGRASRPIEFCIRGHERTEQNVRVRRRANGKIARWCRPCDAARQAKAKAKAVAKARGHD